MRPGNLRLGSLIRGLPACGSALPPPLPPPPSAGTTVGRRSVQAFAGKGSQKNQGMYFEYEHVDGEAADSERRESEAKPSEFGWVQQARQASKSHKSRRQSPGQPKPASKSTQDGKGRVHSRSQERKVMQSTSEQPRQARQQRHDQEQPAPSTQVDDAATSRPSSGSNAVAEADMKVSANAATSAPAVADDPATSTDPTGSSTAYRAASRKQRLMERMQRASTPARSEAQPSLADPKVPAQSIAGSSEVKDLLEMPRVPDLGPLDEDEQQVRELLNSHFVDAAGRSAAVSPIGAAATRNAPLTDAVKSEVTAQREFQRWVQELRNGNGSMLQGQGLDADEIEGMEALLERIEGGEEDEDEDCDTAILSDDETLVAGLSDGPDLAAYLRTASTEFAEFRSLAAQLSMEDAAMGLSDMANDEEGLGEAEEPQDRVMARLRVSDPELFNLLSTTPGGQDDEDLLSMFSTTQSKNPDDEVSDAEVQQILASGAMLRDNDADFLEEDGDEEDESEEAELADLFEAIDDDEDMNEQEKLKATYSLQGIFNAPAEENDVSATKTKLPAIDPAARGVTTTGAGGQSDIPPQLLARPRPRA